LMCAYSVPTYLRSPFSIIVGTWRED